MAYESTKVVTVTPTITAGAYAAGDVVGGLLTFSIGLVKGVIRSVIIVDDSGQNAALKLYFFEPTPSSIADNAAFAPTDADNLLQQGSVEISTYDSVVNSAYVTADLAFSCSGTLYGYLMTNASTPTYTATDDLHIRLVVWAD